MPIPESKLDTWSNQGANQSAKETHKRIRNTLNSSDLADEKNFKIFLQGSYKNDTNIYGDSDVDIVIRLDSTFRRDLSDLSSSEETKYKNYYDSATYSLSDFKNDIIEILRSQYGVSAVDVGNKAVKLETDSLPLDADVLICQQYRKYERFPDRSGEEYIQGIVFFTGNRKKIINYPTRHYDNGCSKSQKTNNRYKETVRIFKNIRSHLKSHNKISSGLAPSYFVECMLYNVPGDKFVHGKRDRMVEMLEWLNSSDIKQTRCQNEVQKLFGSKTTQWNLEDAERFISETIKLWNNWYD